MLLTSKIVVDILLDSYRTRTFRRPHWCLCRNVRKGFLNLIFFFFIFLTLLQIPIFLSPFFYIVLFLLLYKSIVMNSWTKTVFISKHAICPSLCSLFQSNSIRSISSIHSFIHPPITHTSTSPVCSVSVCLWGTPPSSVWGARAPPPPCGDAQTPCTSKSPTSVTRTPSSGVVAWREVEVHTNAFVWLCLCLYLCLCLCLCLCLWLCVYACSYVIRGEKDKERGWQR